MSAEEPWLRGPVEGFIPELQPFAHALLFAREEFESVLARVRSDVVWQSPGNNAATIGYHIRHCSGSTMRMLTYAKGQALSDEQFAQLAAEKTADQRLGVPELRDIAFDAIDAALAYGRTVDAQMVNAAREVGRRRLPSTVRGLLYEIALHTSRHVGQIATTARILNG